MQYIVMYLYCCAVHLVDSLNITLPTNALIDVPPYTRNNVHKYRICCHNNIIKKKFIFLTR